MQGVGGLDHNYVCKEGGGSQKKISKEGGGLRNICILKIEAKTVNMYARRQVQRALRKTYRYEWARNAPKDLLGDILEFRYNPLGSTLSIHRLCIDP